MSSSEKAMETSCITESVLDKFQFDLFIFIPIFWIPCIIELCYAQQLSYAAESQQPQYESSHVVMLLTDHTGDNLLEKLYSFIHSLIVSNHDLCHTRHMSPFSHFITFSEAAFIINLFYSNQMCCFLSHRFPA